MRGTIISINQSANTCVINNPEVFETFNAPCEAFKGQAEFKVGCECEFDVVQKPSFIGLGKATITSLLGLNLKNEKVALTNDANYPDHQVIKENREYLIGAEGGSERECRSALIERAIECHANALLDLKLETVQRPGVKTVLYRYTARPAIIEGPTYHQEPGIGLDIPTKVARRNSPNEAMVRYTRVLLIAFLFVAIPCIMSLTQGGVIPSKLMGQVITAGVLVLCMFLFMFVSFKKKQSFILTLKPIRGK